MILACLLYVSQTILTPWQRVWTQRLDGKIESVNQWKDELVILTNDSVTLVRPETGKTKILVKFDKTAIFPHVAVWKSKLLVRHAVTIGSPPKGLACYDIPSGQLEWALPGKSVESEIVVRGDLAYLSLAPNFFSEVNLATHRVNWTSACGTKAAKDFRTSPHFAAPTVIGNRIVFQNDESVQSWDLTTRTKLFELNSSRYSPPTISPEAIVTYRILEGQPNGSTWSYNFKTGAKLWSKLSPAPGWTYARIDGNSYYGTYKGVLYRYELRSGKEVWKLRLADSKEFSRENFVVTRGETHWLALAGLHEVSADGKLLNSLPLKESFGVVWRGKDYILTNDYDAISCYRQSHSKGDAYKQIERLCEDVLSIDPVDEKFIKDNATIAGPKFLAALRMFLDQPRNEDSEYRNRDRVNRAVQLASACVTSDNTRAMLDEFGLLSPSSPYWTELMTALLKSGNLEAINTYLMVQIFHGKPNVRVKLMLQAALDADRREIGNTIADAINLGRVIKEDQAEATLVVAALGREEFADQLPPEAPFVATVPPLRDQAHKASYKKIAETTLEGIQYQLIEMDTVGNSEDLWIRRVDTNERLFSGASSLGRTLAGMRAPSEGWLERLRAAELAVKKYKSGGWQGDLKRLDALRKDRDNDGLTDLVEKRFGTVLDKGDSDQDGLKDDVDAWPLTPLRPLDDTEKLLSQALLATEMGYFSIISFPAGVKPVQLTSSGGRVFPKQPDIEIENRGMVADLVGFDARYADPDSDEKPQFLTYNPTKTIAFVNIFNSFHGETAIFRKVKTRWILVAIKPNWIS